MPYWIWGVVATLTTIIMLVASGLYVRSWSYEVFLITHILLAVITIAGCWYHVVIHFGYSWGSPQWLMVACGLWFLDRLIRLMRVLKNGICRAYVTDLGDDFVRLDIEDVRWNPDAGMHVYAYFPTVNPLRPWENHPFSVLPTSMLRSFNKTPSTPRSYSGEDLERGFLDKHMLASTTAIEVPAGDTTTAGITLFVKRSTGMTKSLVANTSLMTLLGGPY